MYKVWCEWDLGLEDKIFTTREVAEAYVRAVWSDAGFDEDFTYEAAYEDNFIGYDALEVISE